MNRRERSDTIRPVRVTCLFVVWALGTVSSVAQTTRSTRDRVYSEPQARRGELLFEQRCSECHTPRLWGAEWDTLTAGELFDFIRVNMPEPEPGTLTNQQVVDVIAFFLKSQDLPSGETELPRAFDSLQQIRLERNR